MRATDVEAYVQTDPKLLQLRERVAALRRIGTSEPHEWAQPIQRPRGAAVCDCEKCSSDDGDPLGAAKGIALGIALAALGWLVALIVLVLS